MSDAIDAFSAHAPDYDATRRAIVPCWDAFYGTAVELISLRDGPVERVLDIGAGTGFMSEAVLAAHPSAQLVLLDGSEEMLARASTFDDDSVTRRTKALLKLVGKPSFEAKIAREIQASRELLKLKELDVVFGD